MGAFLGISLWPWKPLTILNRIWRGEVCPGGHMTPLSLNHRAWYMASSACLLQKSRFAAVLQVSNAVTNNTRVNSCFCIQLYPAPATLCIPRRCPANREEGCNDSIRCLSSRATLCHYLPAGTAPCWLAGGASSLPHPQGTVQGSAASLFDAEPLLMEIDLYLLGYDVKSSF